LATIHITWTETGEYQTRISTEEAQALLLTDVDPDRMNDADHAFTAQVTAATPQELAELLADNPHVVTDQWYTQRANRDLLATQYTLDEATVTE
jgi:hypothetical protein